MKTGLMAYWTIGILAFSASVQAAADDCHIEKQAVLPISFNSYTPTVPVIINGHEINMGIDTGAQMSVVTPETVAQLHLPQDRHHFTNVTGTGGVNKVNNVILNSLEFAGTAYGRRNVPVISLTHPVTATEEKVFGPASPMAGLIGADILSGYDIEYDPSARMLTLYHVKNCSNVKPMWQGQFVRVPITITPTNRFAVPVILDGHRISAVFDTGASGERFASSAIADAGLTPEILERDSVNDGYGTNGRNYKTHFHRFGSVAIARELFHNLGMDITGIPADEADMLIGEDYMRTRRFWLSYATQTLFVQRAPR